MHTIQQTCASNQFGPVMLDYQASYFNPIKDCQRNVATHIIQIKHGSLDKLSNIIEPYRNGQYHTPVQ